jgi:hypothetical protein
MHIRFLSHGTGDPQRAKAYLLQKLDHNGVLRPEVRVLRGNPQQVADLAESLDFVHRYTSVVINWHPTDEPSAHDIEAVLDDFELAAFAGMEPDQYAYTAISHGDHVHILAARVELGTGLAHNMAPPQGKKVFEHLRNHWNFQKGWARPDDPMRARAVQPTPAFKSLLSKARALDADELLNAFGVEPELSSREERHAAVVDWIQKQVLDGTINSRENVLSALAKIGTLNRQSDDYLSVRFDDIPKPIRFKGTLFSTSFDPVALRNSFAQPIPFLAVQRDEPDPERAAQERAAFERAVMARSKYNTGRYKVLQLTPHPSPAFIVAAPEEHETDPSRPFSKEQLDDRTGNPAFAEILRIFELSKAAIRRFASACQYAVESTGRLERAGAALKRAAQRFVGTTALMKKRADSSAGSAHSPSNGRPPKV